LRHIDFLRSLEQLRFSGQLMQTEPAGQKWVFYFVQGRIVYATGGIHPVRRWRRHLTLYCPRIPRYRLAWQIDLANAETVDWTYGWEYALLTLWVAQQKITCEQAMQVVRATVTEVLFDLMRATNVTEQIQHLQPSSLSLEPVGVEAAISDVLLQQQAWHHARLEACLPNQAPLIRRPEQFRKLGSTQLYKTLMHLLDGQNTLRDLAVEMRRSIIDVAVSLERCVQLGLIEYVAVADLPAPILRPPPASTPVPSTPPALAPAKLIACVDDSPLVRNMMERLLTSAGYQFLGVEDPLRAIGILLARKPDFIFLDLVMPNVNGYEVCEQLRKLSHFKDTPIVILTGNDGFANRLRSNFVGASDFLSKPLNAELVLGVIDKHLKKAANFSTIAQN